MIRSKETELLAMLLIVIVLALCWLLPGFAQAAGGLEQQYESKLFGTNLITVDIQMEATDWQEMLDNALDETYYACDVTINGQTFYNVGVRPKGNTSLSQVAASESERFSFKLEFDHYEDGQTCWGLDQLVLNNMMSDTTYLKEYLAYDMFRYLGLPASLSSMAQITVNGESWGVYLALEGVQESFLLRNFGVSAGELYKPESMEMGGAPEGMERPEGMKRPEGMEPPDENMAAHMGGGKDPGRMSGGGANLSYTDDALDSYETIWEGAVTDSDDSDHKRVIEALRKIHAGDLDGLDVDRMARYLAVQTFVVNLDSLSGTMAHNYYLYEENGKLSLLPWDYNLAFGGFQSGDGASVVNFPIDTPVSGVSLEERPIFAAILEDSEACALYHTYLRKLAEEYVGGGQFAVTYQLMRNLLDGRVGSDTETDPTAFYTAAEYEAGVTLLKTLVERRAESILGQLDGTIPSTSTGQQADSSALIDAADIDLSVLGTQGGGRGGMPGGDAPGRPDRMPEKVQDAQTP